MTKGKNHALSLKTLERGIFWTQNTGSHPNNAVVSVIIFKAATLIYFLALKLTTLVQGNIQLRRHMSGLISWFDPTKCPHLSKNALEFPVNVIAFSKRRYVLA